jgi:UDP-N-acetylglucosamine 2-epimerase
MPTLFTMPNADAGGREVRRQIEEFVGRTPAAGAVESLGARRYFTVMSLAAAMVGNSSSGIVEAASFGLPVVNVGDRQAGRTRPENVLDVDCNRAEMLAAIRKAIGPEFRSSSSLVRNPYGDGSASSKIVDRLTRQELGPRLLRKKFHAVHRAPDA